jgi:hypothetical protein
MGIIDDAAALLACTALQLALALIATAFHVIPLHDSAMFD